MKKIFTLILIFAAVSAFGQSLSLRYQGTTINSGETLEVTVPQLNVTEDFYLDVANVSESDIVVKVYKIEGDMVQGATASLCFAGNCYPPTVNESDAMTIPAQTTVDSAFHMMYKTPAAGVSYVQFRFVDDHNNDDCAEVTFRLVYDPTNVETVANTTKMRAYPNPASDNVTVEYAVSGNASNARLVVKNLLGATLYTRSLDVNANKVRLDVSEYPAGIYFYSIEADGRPLVTKKLLVK